MHDDKSIAGAKAVAHEGAKRDYHFEHQSCPGCGAPNKRMKVNLGAWSMTPGDEIKNHNKATCTRCGWTGIVHDLKPEKVTEAVKVKESFTVTKEDALADPMGHARVMRDHQQDAIAETGAGVPATEAMSVEAETKAGEEVLAHLDRRIGKLPGITPEDTTDKGLTLTTGAEKFATLGRADHSKNIGVLDTGDGPHSLQERSTIRDVEEMIAFQQQIAAANGLAFGKILDLLQRMLELDAGAVTAMLQTRVPINSAMATTPLDILIGGPDAAPSISVLGLLNTCLMAGFGEMKRVVVTIGDDGGPITKIEKWNPPAVDTVSMDQDQGKVPNPNDPRPLND